MKKRALDLDMRNNAGFTALLLAIQNDRFLNAYILIKHGECSTTLKDNEKRLNAIEWLLNRIETNKDILLNRSQANSNHPTHPEELVAQRIFSNRQNLISSSSFTGNYDSFSSKILQQKAATQTKQRKSLMIDLKLATNYNASLHTARTGKNNNQYFNITNACEHTPKTNYSIDHHSSHFMPVVPILKMTNSGTNIKNAAISNNRSCVEKPPKISTVLNTVLIKSFVIEADKANELNENVTSNDLSVYENLSLKEIVKKLYDTLFERMKQVNKPKRKAANGALDGNPSTNNNRSQSIDYTNQSNRSDSLPAVKSKGKKIRRSIKEETNQVIEEPRLSQADLIKSSMNFSSSSKIELSLDKEIFELEQMRQTPKLLALQKPSSKKRSNKSMKESIHGLLDMYEAELLMGAVIKPNVSDSFEENWSSEVIDNDQNTHIAPLASMSRANNVKSTVSVANFK